MSPAPHPTPQADSCSARSAASLEPLPGTARHANTWVLVEQTGPWGADALMESHLRRDLGEALADATSDTLTHALLIRRPGRHADAHAAGPRIVIVASTHPQRRWMRQWLVSDDKALAQWIAAFDPQAAAEGIPPLGGQLVARSTLAVCTHAKRDLCCALSGRALVDALAAPSAHNAGFDLWECSHLGGHRFAPTALALPAGVVVGRADAEACRIALAGGAPSNRTRGLSWLEPAAQVADLAVRDLLGPTGQHTPLITTRNDPRSSSATSTWSVRSDANGTWLVDVERRHGTPRPASCGKTDESPDWRVAGTPIPAL